MTRFQVDKGESIGNVRKVIVLLIIKEYPFTYLVENYKFANDYITH